MRALLVHGSLTLTERPDPEPAPGEARIVVSLAGICNTDIEIARGYMGFSGVLGHEFVGVVDAVGDPADSAWVGRRVVGEINLGCGRCARCHAGLARHCAARSVLGIVQKDGALAEKLTLPVGNLHAVPEGVPDAWAVFAEPLAAAFEVTEQVHVAPGVRAVVLGDGKLGQLVAQVLQATGADVTLLGRHARKLERAAALGIRVEHPHEASPGGAYDLAVEATGSPEGLARAIALLRPRGTLVLKSTFHGETKAALAPVVIDELTIVGSRCGPFGPALRAMAARRIDPSGLIDATIGLSDAVDAFAAAQRPGVLKVLIDPTK